MKRFTKLSALGLWTIAVALFSAREGALQQQLRFPPMRAVVYEFRTPSLSISDADCRRICTARNKQRKEM